MLNSQILGFFCFPAAIFLIAFVIVPSAWFQRLNPFFKIGIGILSGLGFWMAQQYNPIFLLPLTVQIALSCVLGIVIAYRFYRSDEFRALQNKK